MFAECTIYSKVQGNQINEFHDNRKNAAIEGCRHGGGNQSECKITNDKIRQIPDSMSHSLFNDPATKYDACQHKEDGFQPVDTHQRARLCSVFNFISLMYAPSSNRAS
jgi:hypothetical protein